MLKIFIMIFVATLAFCLLCIIGAATVKAESDVVRFEDMEFNDLVVAGIEVSERTDVEINTMGAGSKYSKGLFAYGWIIDAQDRDLIWSMQDDCFEVDRVSEYLTECHETISLRRGKYEVYYYVGRPNIFINTKGVEGLGDVIALVGDLLSGEDIEDEEFYEDDASELYMTIKADDNAVTSYTPVFEAPDGAVAFISRPEKDEYHHQGFSLKEKIDLEIYAIGEFAESYDVFVDGGWIIDADSREKVWSMDKWNTERAGGAPKNRMARDEITLPAGNYIAYYATDDSHDPGEWNAPPPTDPNYYGMVIITSRPADNKSVSTYDEAMNEIEIVDLTRIRDDAFEKAGFTLKKDARLHIVGLGERDYSNDFLVDYGWIVDAGSLERVWEMTSENTGFAGGGAKNALFDGMVELPAGDYIVYYRSDGSHSYKSWNVSPPFNKTGWGIAVYGVGKDFDDNSFVLVDEFHTFTNALVDLTGLGDDEEVSQTFTLDETTSIRILAVGEGKGNYMYDYGWVENENTGEIVWEMTYRKTRHAGGASKNRKVVANITLESGTYSAHFVTDDSHSYEDFNASPPDEPERWGMIVTKK